MESDLMSIGKMAEMNHVTVATLRLYDKLGLLRPRHVDPDTGYRYYDIQQNARLDLIAYMKELGMSLSEIGDVLRREDPACIEEILIRKNEQIYQQIRDLRAQNEAVEQAIAAMERFRKSPATGMTALEYIDRRYIWSIPCAGNFYEQGISGFEQELLRLRRAMLDEGFAHVHSFSTGTSISMDHFLAGELVPDRLFSFLNHRAAAQHSGSIVVDSGMYACIYLDRFEDEPDSVRQLLDFCRRNRYTVCGDYICEILTEFNIFDSAQRNMFLRLQVPVSFQQNGGRTRR